MSQRFFPGTLEANDEVFFQIRCRKFVEMIAESNSGMDLDADGSEGGGMDEFDEALVYGQRLQDDYRNDDRVSVQNKLVVCSGEGERVDHVIDNRKPFRCSRTRTWREARWLDYCIRGIGNRWRKR